MTAPAQAANGTAAAAPRRQLPPQTDEAFIASAGPKFVPAPDGPHAAVCCDILYLGKRETQWKGKPKTVDEVRILFQIDAIEDATKKRYVVGRTFTKSLSDNANLRKFLESWRGVPFTEQQLEAFQLLQLLNAPAFIQIKHATKGDRTYANIDAVMRMPRGMAPLTVVDYVRVKDRPQVGPDGAEQPPHPAELEDFPLEDEDDDLPF